MTNCAGVARSRLEGRLFVPVAALEQCGVVLMDFDEVD